MSTQLNQDFNVLFYCSFRDILSKRAELGEMGVIIEAYYPFGHVTFSREFAGEVPAALEEPTEAYIGNIPEPYEGSDIFLEYRKEEEETGGVLRYPCANCTREDVSLFVERHKNCLPTLRILWKDINQSIGDQFF